MYAYGPVPSRRFGRSLGVSPIPEKTCSYSCIYCQLGRTKNLTPVRQSFFDQDDIFSDIEKVARVNISSHASMQFILRERMRWYPQGRLRNLGSIFPLLRS